MHTIHVLAYCCYSSLHRVCIYLHHVCMLMQFNHPICWSHVVDLYMSGRSSAQSLTVVPKLKYEHIFLTSFSKMGLTWLLRFVYTITPRFLMPFVLHSIYINIVYFSTGHEWDSSACNFVQDEGCS